MSNDTPIVSVRSLLDIRRNSPRYRDTEKEKRQKWLMGRIVYCNALNHIKPDANFIKIDTVALDEAMMRDPQIADLTAPEISFAMYHGTMGEYGEYYGLTAKTFLGFFREFFKTDIKFCVMMEEKKAEQPVRGTWVLERMEYQRQQVEQARADQELKEETDAVLEGWKKNITSIINTQNNE